ncbi:MAG: HD domain-containing protein [bacterium]
MTREETLIFIRQAVKNTNSIKHMLATEAIMRALAKRFNEDEVTWALAGLVHDIDMEFADYKENPEKHGIEGARMLAEKGFVPEIIEAVKAHNPATGKTRETLMEKTIFCTDPLTGLIVAATLVLPSKKIGDLTSSSVLKRFRENSFARGVNREVISACAEIGLTLEEFIEIGLKAMQEIAGDLGL